MKILILPCFLLLIYSCNQPNKSNESTADTLKVVKKETEKPIDTPEKIVDDPIIDIRKKVEKINTTTLTTKHFELMCDELMKVDYYYDNDQIVKISVDFGTIGDVYAKEDYYYDAGKLIFKYEFVEGGPACDDCIKTNEYRSYIKQNKVIKYLKDKTETTCRLCEFTDYAKENRLLFAKNVDDIRTVMCKSQKK